MGRIGEMPAGDERFRVIVDSVKDYAILMLDPEGRIETWNAGAEIMKGYKAGEVIGKSIELFYTAEDRQLGKPAALLAEARASGRAESEGWRVRKDGSLFWADAVVTSIKNDAGDFVGFVK